MNNRVLNATQKYKFEHFNLFCILHIAFILTSMTVTARMISINVSSIAPLFITGGTLSIPLVFFIQDIVTEIDGYHNALKMLYISLSLFVIYGVFIYLFVKLHPLTEQNTNPLLISLNTIPRHVISFTVSLAIGGIVNCYILSKLKIMFNARFLAFRFISSTMIGEAVFQIIAVLIAWQGVYSFHHIIFMAFISYTYKVIFEVLSTPLNIFICNRLKPSRI